MGLWPDPAELRLCSYLCSHNVFPGGLFSFWKAQRLTESILRGKKRTLRASSHQQPPSSSSPNPHREEATRASQLQPLQTLSEVAVFSSHTCRRRERKLYIVSIHMKTEKGGGCIFFLSLSLFYFLDGLLKAHLGGGLSRRSLARSGLGQTEMKASRRPSLGTLEIYIHVSVKRILSVSLNNILQLSIIPLMHKKSLAISMETQRHKQSPQNALHRESGEGGRNKLRSIFSGYCSPHLLSFSPKSPPVEVGHSFPSRSPACSPSLHSSLNQFYDTCLRFVNVSGISLGYCLFPCLKILN